MQSLCTLRDHGRQWPRNTRYQADATPYLGRTSTGWIAPACGWRTHSITSSARASKVGGTSRPSAFAVVRLRTNSNFVDCTTGRSAGITSENPAGIDADLMIRIRDAGSVAHQAAGHGGLPKLVDRGHRMARCQGDQLVTPAEQERIGGDKQCAGPLLDESCKGSRVRRWPSGPGPVLRGRAQPPVPLLFGSPHLDNPGSRAR